MPENQQTDLPLNPLLSRVESFRDILRAELEARCARNPLYSLRAFARDLSLHPARLSDILRARYGLSTDAAAKIAQKLGFGAAEAKRFCDLVELAHGRNKIMREAARARLAAGSPNNYQQLSMDAFSVIADWYHYAILELTLVSNFKSDTAWIARTLGINEVVAKAAVERLLRLELLALDETGRLHATDCMTASPDGVPSEAVKRFHEQILQKASTAVRLQSVEERDLSSVILAIDSSEMAEAKAMIKDFRRSFDKRFGGAASSRKNRVYALAIQFFNLQETE